MKRFLFGILVIMAVLMIIGTIGDMYLHSEHCFVTSQKKLAKQNEQIEALCDSIAFLNEKAEVLQITLDCLRDLDSSKVEEVEQLLWNIKEE
jgi:hypothetical protein